MIPKPVDMPQILTGQVEILLPGVFDHGFDYMAPPGMELSVGRLVSVPFGKNEVLGVVSGHGTATIKNGKIKNILNRIEDIPPLPSALLEFAKWAAWYNCTPLGTVLKMILPNADIINDVRKDTAVKIHTVIDMHAATLATLSGTQQDAANQITETIGKGFSVTLLDGVTGSGKTEVYFDAIAASLKNRESRIENRGNAVLDSQFSIPNSQILVLLPEIALSVQWLERFKRRFGFLPAIWNSEVTPARKRATWQAVARGEARIVVGARSALFLPYQNLQLIVADEEHDASYKQEEGVIYHARDMAVARARFEKIPIVLVSATPSLETHYNARQGKYTEIALPARHGEAEMPELAMLDMRSVPTERGAFISTPLREALAKTLAAGHQSMLFLNRRGYAPLMLCRTCGHRFQCPDCSSWLVLHAKGMGYGVQGKASDSNPKPYTPTPFLQCHHCNHRIPVPNHCPSCNAEESLHACGPGVERVHEEVSAFLPQARVAVLASDQTDNVKALTEVIEAMERKEIDVLIGTQMIAKGHHFAGIATVGVVDADLGLGGGDLRAAEKTYQLLHQLSGRAGRESIKGTVYLQSYLPEHPVMKALMKGGRDEFLAAELDARREAHMPPFSRLAAIIVEGKKEDMVIRTAKLLASTVHHSPSTIHLLGPAPAPLYRLRDKFRYRLLIKADRKINVPELMKNLVESVKAPSSVRVKIDIDPVSFL
jgi:primosomal protein N' (replication factor Y)